MVCVCVSALLRVREKVREAEGEKKVGAGKREESKCVCERVTERKSGRARKRQ